MKVVTAHAMTVLAKAYIEDSPDNNQLKQFTAIFENTSDDETTFMVPNDVSIQNQIHGLEELKSLLTSSPVPARNTMILLKDDKGNSGIQ